MAHREPHSSPRRSRSPTVRSHHKRQRSPHSHHHHTSFKRPKPAAPVNLPFHASPLSKGRYEQYKPLFGLYLDIQKQKVLEELPEDEVNGRWKSLVGKWNRGELAEGWYDPATLQKAQASAASYDDSAKSPKPQDSPGYGSPREEESSGEDIVGPALPGRETVDRKARRLGAAVPNTQDLQLRRELEQEDALARRQDLRYERKVDRTEQKHRLDEILPRAEAGSKDRMLEKKREKADSNRAFASAKTEAGGVEEVPESDLLGGEDGGIEGFKKQKREMDRKKNEREVRREEILRVRMEEREEKRREYAAKEERTMSGLVALAKARFG